MGTLRESGSGQTLSHGNFKEMWIRQASLMGTRKSGSGQSLTQGNFKEKGIGTVSGSREL